MMAGSAFAERQRKFIARLASDESELARGCVVVLPSISFPAIELAKITGIAHYEERMLFTLLWLAEPARRVVFVSSVGIDRDIVDYYLAFLDDPEDARRRLTLIDLNDPEPRALSSKLIEREDALARIAAAVANGDGRNGSYVFPFNVSEWERAVCDRLDLPLFGPTPEQAHLGSKSGSRALARRAGVPVVPGSEDLHSLDDLGAAVERLRADDPELPAVLIKLNYGFSGQGNAIIEVPDLATPLDASRATFCATEESWTTFVPKVAAEGAVVEELLRRPGAISPSVQMRIAPSSGAEITSTHDQILGGPDDQVYLGCRFPAREAYRADISERALRIGAVLADEGVIGAFGMDFIGVPDRDGYATYLGEINLRLGGTTHPFHIARLVTGGTYSGDGHLLVAGEPRFYVSTDNLKSAAYRKLTPRAVIDLVAGAGLAFDGTTGRGATLHLLGALAGFGKLGTVCIERSRYDAQVLFDELVAVLDATTV